jgi:hypothetical protein
MSSTPITTADLAWLTEFEADRIDVTASRRALAVIDAARDVLEDSFDLPLEAFEYASRPAPEANLDRPALLRRQAE